MHINGQSKFMTREMTYEDKDNMQVTGVLNKAKRTLQAVVRAP